VAGLCWGLFFLGLLLAVWGLFGCVFGCLGRLCFAFCFCFLLRHAETLGGRGFVGLFLFVVGFGLGLLLVGVGWVLRLLVWGFWLGLGLCRFVGGLGGFVLFALWCVLGCW